MISELTRIMLNTLHAYLNLALDLKLLTKKGHSDLSLWALMLTAYYGDRVRCEFVKLSICDRPLYFHGQWIHFIVV